MLLRKFALALIVFPTPVAHPPAHAAAEPQQDERSTQSKPQNVLVPNFCNDTLAQVKAKIGGRDGRDAMFAAVVPHGSDNGFVVTQSPAANTLVVPGLRSLLLTLSPSRSANCSSPIQTPTQTTGQTLLQTLSHIFTQTNSKPDDLPKVPYLYQDTPAVAFRLVTAARLKPRFEGPQNGLVAQQIPQAGSPARPGSTVLITLALPDVTVPLLTRMTLAEATTRLQQSSLQLGSIDGPQTDTSIVTAQSPSPGSQVPSGTPVGVTLYAYTPPPPTPEQVAVPNLTAKTSADATADLTSLNLRLGTVRGPSNGLVSAQTVPPGTLVDIHSSVGFTLLRRRVVVPNVLGETQADATTTLNTFNLVPKFSQSTDPQTTAPLVIATQEPASGTSVAEDTTVSLVLGPQAVTPPPPPVPIWVWPLSALAILTAAVVILRRPTPIRIPPPLPICTLVPSTPTAHIKLDSPTGPALRFAVTLQDHLGKAGYQTPLDPAVTPKG
jgi:beta-lactam-binding protein with PASTA domain